MMRRREKIISGEHTGQEAEKARSRLYVSALLVLMALVAMTAATVAWFSIADRTKVQTMSLDIAADPDMRMDLDPHKKFSQYVKTLTFDAIASRIQKEKGFSMKETPLEPVTTSDTKTFTYENGTVVKNTTGAYLEFTLHFMAEKDMTVHLSSANSRGKEDGTKISSKNPGLPPAMRISFTADGQTWIYDPGMGATVNGGKNVRTFGLPGTSGMKLSACNAMFSLKKNVNKPVLVHIWVEGTDPACTDALKAADYAIRLRFTGEAKDEKNKVRKI